MSSGSTTNPNGSQRLIIKLPRPQSSIATHQNNPVPASSLAPTRASIAHLNLSSALISPEGGPVTTRVTRSQARAMASASQVAANVRDVSADEAEGDIHKRLEELVDEAVSRLGEEARNLVNTHEDFQAVGIMLKIALGDEGGKREFSRGMNERIAQARGWQRG